LPENCERNLSLGYDLFKRMAPVLLRRLQCAPQKMLSIRAGSEKLAPANGD